MPIIPERTTGRQVVLRGSHASVGRCAGVEPSRHGEEAERGSSTGRVRVIYSPQGRVTCDLHPPTAPHLL